MRLAGADKPIRCSVCFQPPMVREPQPEYVDFEAVYEGPVVTDPQSEVTPYLDKIVICEDCVREGARLLGMDHVERYQAELEAAREQLKESEREARKKDRAISDLTHTVGTLIDHPVKRPAGKPQLQGPESHEKEIKQLRSNRSKAEKISKAKRKVVSGADGN